MKIFQKEKCLHCKELFALDRRNLRHQRYCRKPGCQKASKSQSQRRWLAKKANQNYFCGPENIRRVQEWRDAHPGYGRKKSVRQEPLQDVLQDDCRVQEANRQALVSKKTLRALQDVFKVQPALIVGLIATMTGSVAQEDIRTTTRLLVRKGQDIIRAVSIE